MRDSYKLSLFVAAIFFASILASAYVLYSLPHNLMLTDGFQSVFAKTYGVIAVTYIALRSQREVIVYRDRSQDIVEEEANNTSIIDETKTTITLDGIKASLKEASTEKGILQAGLHTICKQLDAGQGALYLTSDENGQRKVELKQGYALSVSENSIVSFDFGEGLVGQSAANGQTLYVDDIPEGYIKIISGLGSASPRYLLIVPVKQGEKVMGVMEIASFTSISEDQRKFVEESAKLLGEKISISHT